MNVARSLGKYLDRPVTFSLTRQAPAGHLPLTFRAGDTEGEHLPRQQENPDQRGSAEETHEGRFEFGGKRAMVMDIAGGLYALKKALKADIGYFEREFMFRAGQEGAKYFFAGSQPELRKMDKREALEAMLQQYSLRGFGEFEVKRFDVPHEIVEVTSPNTMESWAFRVNKDLQREAVCSYTSGVLAMISKFVLLDDPENHEDFAAAETECAAEGSRECRFIIAPPTEIPKLVPGYEPPRESIPEHVLRLNEEILMKNLELQSLNLTLERLVRKRTEDLRRSEENYRLLLELSPDPIVVCKMDGDITSVNPAGVSMLGYDSKDEFEGLNLKSLLKGGAVDWEKLLWQIEKEGAVHGFDVELARRDGTMMVGEVSARFADLATGRCVETVIRDITEKKVIQAQIAEARSESEFLNDLMSHDIINYTMSALYFLRNLDKSERLSEDDRKLLGIVLKDIQGAFELSSSVRDLARLKSTTEEDVEIKELQSMIVEGVEEAKKLYSERKIRINFDRSPDPKFIKGNALVSRIFTNLVTNAIKFDPREEVVVDIDVDNEVDHGVAYWKVTISDYGGGIPDEEKEKVFERFHRLNASIPGTGLGLFVVRFIAKSVGGRVWAENRVAGNHSKGTKMIVMLPKATERQVASMGRRHA